MSVNAFTEEYEYIELFGKPGLFTNARIDRDTVPEGWYAYDLRGSDYDPGEPPETDGLVGCWQYASDGRVSGHAGNLDVNHFFGSVGAWQAYAGVPSSGQPDPSPSQSVLENDRFRVTIQEK